MDKKTLFALTAKIFNTLKGIGIKPKLGVTTGVKRLPGSKNSFNTDLSALGEGNPEALKKLIANDADFLPQATADEIVQYNNNLEYLKSTYPDTFAKAQVVTESKTGIKTLVDDVDEKIKRPTKEDYEDYGEILNDSENTVVQGTETFDELEALVKKQKDYEASMYQEYRMGRLDPAPGEKSQNRLNFLRKKADEAEMTKDRRLISMDEIQELEELEGTFQPRTINISDPKTAESFTNFARQNDPEGFKKIQKIVDDINNKNTLENFDIKDREPNAKGGSVGNLTYKKMFGDLDKTLGKGLGTMFKKRRR
jgi:cell division protein ZapA (FtsZ GTPase activity inhibitor)